MMMTITAAPEAPNTTTTATATTGAITTSNDWDSIKITKSNTKIKPLKVLIAFTAISLKLVYCCCRTPTTATKTPAAAREEKMESIRIICWVCVRAVQTEKPFICSTHLSLCIVFFLSHCFCCSFSRILFFSSHSHISFSASIERRSEKKPLTKNQYSQLFFLPFSKVCSASDGSQCRHSSPKRRKLFPCPSSWPSTGKTNCDENVLPNKSVIFRKTSSRWVSIFRLIECAKASLKINYANYNCEYGANNNSNSYSY